MRAWAVVLHAQEKPAAAISALHCSLELVEGGGLIAPTRGDPTPPGIHHNAVVRDAAKAHLHLCRPLSELKPLRPADSPDLLFT